LRRKRFAMNSSAGEEVMAEGCSISLGENQYKWLCSLYERAPLGLFRADENWVLVDTNPQLAKILGYESKSEIVDINLLSKVVIDVDKLEALPAILREKGSVDAYRVRARKKDGTIVWLSLYCSLSQENGKVWFDGFAIDFTKRKQLADELRRERRNYHRLITNLPGIVYTVNLEGEPALVFVSPQVESILGVPTSEVLSKGGFFEGLIHILIGGPRRRCRASLLLTHEDPPSTRGPAEVYTPPLYPRVDGAG
jgi:PAS domain S-box-containing protein